MKLDQKLAVLISGSYRNFDDIWPRNKEILDSLGVPYDVYFHTWTLNPNITSNVLELKYQNKFYLSLLPKIYVDFPDNFSVDSIKDKFGFYSIEVEEFDENRISNEYKLGSRNTNTLFQSQLNSCGMYLGIDACYKKIDYSRNYSHFLRLRPDFLLGATNIEQLFNCDLIFLGQLLLTDEGLIGDQCYGGDFSTSSCVFNTLDCLHEVTHSPDWDITKPVALAENIIRLTIKEIRTELKILFFPGSGSIQRPEIKYSFRLFGKSFLLDLLQHNLFVALKRIDKLIYS